MFKSIRRMIHSHKFLESIKAEVFYAQNEINSIRNEMETMDKKRMVGEYYDTSRGFKATINQKELQAFEERKNKILNELKVKILAIIWEAQKKVYWINSS